MSQENNKSLSAQSIKTQLKYYQQSGVDFLPRNLVENESNEEDNSMKSNKNKEPVKKLTVDDFPVLDPDLKKLRADIGDCTLCRLSEGRTQLVFGEGNPNAELMFVGEAPGADEDVTGRPFVGRAGKLLTDMIEKGMGIARSDVYICNIVKCRPPSNRNPEPDEIKTCIPFLKKQIALVKPKVIVALGKFAAQTLLETETPISKLRGEFATYEGTQFMPTYHPAFLLRNPAMKKPVWEDLQKVMRVLGLPVPKK